MSTGNLKKTWFFDIAKSWSNFSVTFKSFMQSCKLYILEKHNPKLPKITPWFQFYGPNGYFMIFPPHVVRESNYKRVSAWWRFGGLTLKMPPNIKGQGSVGSWCFWGDPMWFLTEKHMCQGLNSHYFPIIGDGHQPTSRGLYTHYKDSY